MAKRLTLPPKTIITSLTIKNVYRKNICFYISALHEQVDHKSIMVALGEVHGSGGGGLGGDLDEFTDSLDAFLDKSRAARCKLVALLLGRALIGHDPVTVDLSPVLISDDGDIDIAAGTEIVKDTSLDGLSHQVHSLLFVQSRAVVGLEDGHGRKGPGAHGHKWKAIHTAMRIDSVKTRSSRVNSTQDECSPNVSLMPEQILLQHRHGRRQSHLTTTVETVQLQL